MSILDIERPDAKLMVYYALRSLLVGPLFPVLLVLGWFRYHTLRYRFDDEGISMAWGILFRREVHLTYSRIQDLHLVSNVVERWLGLARIQVQTASAGAQAEMTIEGLLEFEALRDFLYSKMRGHADGPRAGALPAPTAQPGLAGAPNATDDDLAAALREIARELRAVRVALAERERRASGDV